MRWRVVGTSIRGSGHEKNGLPCQDAHQVEHLPGGILIAAVADGAGSAKLADLGAELAARRSTEYLYQRLRLDTLPTDDEAWKALFAEAMTHARTAIETEAARRVMRPNELACTLILLVAMPNLLAAAQIGDGAVVLRCDSDEAIHPLTRPRSGEYVNETTFLITENAVQTAQFAFWREKVEAIAVFSDGLQTLALKLPEAAPHVPFFKPLFKFARDAGDPEPARKQLESFLASPRVTQRTDDDLTLLLITPLPDQP